MNRLRLSFGLIVFLLLSLGALAGEIKVTTLNCYLLFSPAVAHPGNVAKEHPLSTTEYAQKLENLLSLVKGSEFIALEETGGRTEIEDLAKTGHYEWAFAKGKDTYTGEEVGALYALPGWKVTVNGRVGELDGVISKHLLVTATKERHTVHFLVVHLIRPIGQNAAKHERQLQAIAQWASEVEKNDPASIVVIAGDTNDTRNPPGSSIYGIGKDVGELLGFAATHLDGKNYDRLTAVGPATWRDAFVRQPPYGKRPNDMLKRVWTDHFALGATLHLD